MQRIGTLIATFAVLILAACIGPVNTNQLAEITPIESLPADEINENVDSQEIVFPVSGYEQARDVGVAYVAERAEVPVPGGEWIFQHQTQQNSDKALAWLFTDGPWAVQVSVPAISPEPLEYSVMIDHLSAIIRWEGIVDSFGNIVETNFVQGNLPESPQTPEERSWIGVVVSNPPGSQFDDYFQSMDQNGTRYGLDSAGDALKEQLVSYRDSGVVIQIWGIFQKDVPDAYEVQILVTRIEPY